MISVAVLTVSDSASDGTREDLSGPAVRKRCEDLGWTVLYRSTIPDDIEAIRAQLIAWADKDQVQLVLTTGGTGVALRDVTPEATRQVIEKELPGLSDLMRTEGLKRTKYAVLSRALAGTRGGTLVVNLPGSPRGAVESLDAIAPVIPHAIDIATGRTAH